MGESGTITYLKSWDRGPWSFVGIEVGGRYRGKVSGINEDIGIFVDVGGARGLVRRSEVDWGRVPSLTERVAVGDEVAVEVLDLDRKGGRMGLSMKRLVPNPWEEVAERCVPGSFIYGRVSAVEGHGCLVEIGGGLEARAAVATLDEEVDVDDERWFEVLSVGPERGRMALSLRGAAALNDELPEG